VLSNVGVPLVKDPVARKPIEPACELAPQRSAPHSAAPKIQVFLHPIASFPLMLTRTGKTKMAPQHYRKLATHKRANRNFTEQQLQVATCSEESGDPDAVL
jgi:hypothetical protein